MRIPIRVQLGSLLLISSLIGLAVISIAVWVTTHSFVLQLRASSLASTASLKALQLDSNLNIMRTAVSAVSTRVLIQHALGRYNTVANNTAANWVNAMTDMQSAIGGDASPGQTLLLQSMVSASNLSGPAGQYPVLNSTGDAVVNQIRLPYTYPNGTHILLGANDTEAAGLGYPPLLYPPDPTNSTSFDVKPFLLGPVIVNSTFALVSLTMPIINITNATNILGRVTVVLEASLIQQVLQSNDGLDATGQILLLGPANNTNLYPSNIATTLNNTQAEAGVEVRYVFPLNISDSSRHPNHIYGTSNLPFSVSQYPAVAEALEAKKGSTSSFGSKLRTKNENGDQISAGFAIPKTTFVDWVVIVEYSRTEVWQPINHLREVILACLFATAGFMAIVSYPLAHFASFPILRLRKATTRSVEPPGAANYSSEGSLDLWSNERSVDGTQNEHDAVARKEGVKNPVSKWKRQRDANIQARRDERRKRAFRIPGKVKERKNWVKDELSDLTATFNEMSDELMMQYSKLEERVAQRTAELELSKKAAEAANASKTLFIANISHELKTPLNGIMGMCAVCMQEEDPLRLKRSLGIIYKSGDLLLNLLNDLLTFSKNQVQQQIQLDEKEFRIRDVSSQMLAIFEKQAREGQVDLRVDFEGLPADHGDDVSLERTEFGPAGTGRVRDMILWGDLQRILQVVINLVSNSLKFTPQGGSVMLTIRCLNEVGEPMSRHSSLVSRHSKPRLSHSDSEITTPIMKVDTATAINVKDRSHWLMYEQTASPPPGKTFTFEFEVADSGPGIPDSLQHEIFEPFVQGDLGLTKKYGGTGLGLSICSQLARLMRGVINVRSTVGIGSTFTMSIPLRHIHTRADSTASSAINVRLDTTSRSASLDDGEGLRNRQARAESDDGNVSVEMPPQSKMAATGGVSNESQPRLIGLSQPFFASNQPMESAGLQDAAMEKLTAEATRSGKIRVLVAEDNTVNQEVVLRMLKLEDIYDVTVARDGQEALDLVKESMREKDHQPFNLIFMDVQMPNVDGLQSTRLIREIGYEAPIVALTAFSEESNIQDCLNSGMNYFL